MLNGISAFAAIGPIIMLEYKKYPATIVIPPNNIEITNHPISASNDIQVPTIIIREIISNISFSIGRRFFGRRMFRRTVFSSLMTSPNLRSWWWRRMRCVTTARLLFATRRSLSSSWKMADFCCRFNQGEIIMNPRERDERLQMNWVHSRHLENNKLGDPADRQLTVCLPPSYHKSKTKHYPVAYLLHGFGNCAWNWGSEKTVLLLIHGHLSG